ncbi:unnamed protein product, partial [Musa textilis]
GRREGGGGHRHVRPPNGLFELRALSSSSSSSSCCCCHGRIRGSCPEVTRTEAPPCPPQRCMHFPVADAPRHLLRTAPAPTRSSFRCLDSSFRQITYYVDLEFNFSLRR